VTTGVLCLHGITGSPKTVKPVADALRVAGFDVASPALPGHGTVIEDMLDTTFDDWFAHVEAAHGELASRHDRVVVFGLSMGGTLAAQLATRHPDIAGVVFVNPAVLPTDPFLRSMVVEMIELGDVYAPSTGDGGSDIADPDAVENAYAETPLRPVLSLFDAIDALQPDLPKITCPIVIMTSLQDHVVDPVASDHLASLVSGPVERVTLERSYHVATLDYDKQLVIDTTLDFVRKLSARDL
jgi:carboxylesterase